MPAKIIDGKAVAARIRAELKQKTDQKRDKVGRPPGLAVILVGSDPASEVYVGHKRRACAEVGYHSESHDLPDDVTEDDLLALIDKLNADDHVDGILVQLPLPDHIDAETVIERIRPDKDVDGFHPTNVGKLLIGNPYYSPCTPFGIQELLSRSGSPVEGAEVVVTEEPGSVVPVSRGFHQRLDAGETDHRVHLDESGRVRAEDGRVDPERQAFADQWKRKQRYRVQHEHNRQPDPGREDFRDPRRVPRAGCPGRPGLVRRNLSATGPGGPGPLAFAGW